MQSIPQSYILVLAIFTAVTAIAVLIQAGVLLGMFIVMRKAMVKVMRVVDEALPAISASKELLEDIGPKLKTATANLTEVSETVRHEAKYVSETVDEVLAKVNTQLNRVDRIVTSTFDAVDHVTGSVEGALSSSGRRFSGVIHGVKTGVEVFFGSKRRSSYRDANGASSSSDEPEVVPSEPLKSAGFVAGQR